MSNLIKYENTAVVIPAAGLSSRMGFPKPFLLYDEKRFFIDKIIDEYQFFGCAKIVVVTGKPEEDWKSYTKERNFGPRLHFIKNMHPEYERFYSIKLGLTECRDMDYCFIQNADNPFLEQGLLTKLRDAADTDGYVVPTYKGKGGHPILVGGIIIKDIAAMENKKENLKNVLKSFNRTVIETDNDSILININTNKDYRDYFLEQKNLPGFDND